MMQLGMQRPAPLKQMRLMEHPIGVKQFKRSKVEKAEGALKTMELRLQEAKIENAKLIVKQKEDAKMWKGLDAKYLPTKALFDQMMDTFAQIEHQVQQGEEIRDCLQDKLVERHNFYDEMQSHTKQLISERDQAEADFKSSKTKLQDMEKEKECLEEMLKKSSADMEKLVTEKDLSVQENEDLQKALEETKLSLTSAHAQIEEELRRKKIEVVELQEKIAAGEEELGRTMENCSALQRTLVEKDNHIKQSSADSDAKLEQYQRELSLLEEKYDLSLAAERENYNKQAKNSEVLQEKLSHALFQLDEFIKQAEEHTSSYNLMKEELNATVENLHKTEESHARTKEEETNLRAMLDAANAAERAAVAAKKEVQQQLVTQRGELQRHLKEICQRNNQVKEAKDGLEILLAQEKEKHSTFLAALREKHKTEIIELKRIHDNDKRRSISQNAEEWRTHEEGLTAALGTEKLNLLKTKEKLDMMALEYEQGLKKLRAEAEDKSRHEQENVKREYTELMEGKIKSLQTQHDEAIKKLTEEHERKLTAEVYEEVEKVRLQYETKMQNEMTTAAKLRLELEGKLAEESTDKSAGAKRTTSIKKSKSMAKRDQKDSSKKALAKITAECDLFGHTLLDPYGGCDDPYAF
eukprot:jgi/Mesen1/10323/ME000796S09701